MTNASLKRLKHTAAQTTQKQHPGKKQLQCGIW